MSSAIVRLLLPAACAAAALILRYQLAGQSTVDSSSQLYFLLRQLPYILLTLATLIALLSNHAQEAGASISLLIGYWLIQTYLQSPLSLAPASQIFYLLTLLTPTLIITYSLWPQNNCQQLQGVLAIALAPLLMAVILLLNAVDDSLLLKTATETLTSGLLGGHLSGISWMLYGLAAALCLVFCLSRQRSFDSSLLGCTLMTVITYHWIQLTSISACLFAGMGLLLTINITISLLQIGYRDDLTQIGNRRALQQAAKTLRGPYSIAMVDADYFKKINDRFGHDLGDQALRAIASLLKQTADGSRAYRYGGEEFCLLFKGKTKQEVIEILEASRQAIANYDMVIRNKQQRPKKPEQGEKRRGASRRHSNVRLTVSIGVASNDTEMAFDQVLKSADRALYKAKSQGRNCVQAA